jgi:hypothetical protein
MVAGVVFVVCAWFEWLFRRWWGLVLWSLGMSLGSEALFGWHSVGALLSS